jgi:hypothetical protein
VRSKEGILVVALAALAAVRVFFFAAAFPFFANVDEHRHVDMVLKYGRGYLPGPEADSYEPEMATYLGIYGSPEYLQRPADRGGGPVPPPAWQRAAGGMLDRIESSRQLLGRMRNLEARQPPVYYALAGAWLDLGRLLGVDGGRLLYWVRGLNVLVIFSLVLASYLLLRDAVPGNAFLRLGVPVLLTVFPQDTFYYVTPDVLSPLLVGTGFLLAVRLARRPQSSGGAYAALALLASAAFLTKYTNATLLIACALCTAYSVARHPSARSLRADGGKWLLLWSLIALPIACWLVRNQLLFEDPMGTAVKLKWLGWGTRSFAGYWDHPIFTPSGLFGFVTGLIPTFWRGQLAWYRTTLAWGGADLCYTASTLVCLLLAALGLRRRSGPQAAPLLEGLGWAALLASAAVLVGLSLVFTLTETSDPPATKPYFTHGRLISGVLLPFLVLYLRGIQVAVAALPARARSTAAWTCLAALVGVIAISEISVTREVFQSAYNWFHLP